jgi:hypothetical protein
MSEKEGTVRMVASGQSAVYSPGRLPVEITSGSGSSRSPLEHSGRTMREGADRKAAHGS